MRRDRARPGPVGKHADGGADRVADEHDRARGEFVKQVQQVVGIPLQVVVAYPVIGQKVRAAGPDQVEQDYPEAGCEHRRHEPPHVLVATETMGEHHGGLALARDPDIVALAQIVSPSHVPS